MTIAHTIARRFGNDGLKMLPEMLEVLNATTRPHFEYDVTMWVFSDGSAIVQQGSAWDIRSTECPAHCWEGCGCQCAEQD